MAPTENVVVPVPEKTDRELLLEYIGSNATALDKLTTALAALAAPTVPDEGAIRIAKLEKLYGFFIKHTKLKEYKPYDSIDVRLWLHQFYAAVDSIASAGCGLDLVAKPLTPAEFVKLLKTKINYQVESEILQSLRATGKEWATATIAEVRTAMQQLYMRREPKICSILKLFSRDRLKKGNLSVAAYYAKWKEDLPPFIDCKTDAEKIEFHDSFMTSSFYYGLEDPFLQKEVSNIPEEKQNLKSILEGSIAAEGRAIHFKDTLNRGHAIDCASELTPSTAPAVSRTDSHWSNNSNKHGKGRDSWQGSRCNF